MIETKEDWKYLKLWLMRDRDVSDPPAEDTRIIETIEALREVARAGKAWSDAHLDPRHAHCNTKYCVTSDQVRDAVDALPDWILENETP